MQCKRNNDFLKANVMNLVNQMQVSWRRHQYLPQVPLLAVNSIYQPLAALQIHVHSCPSHLALLFLTVSFLKTIFSSLFQDLIDIWSDTWFGKRDRHNVLEYSICSSICLQRLEVRVVYIGRHGGVGPKDQFPCSLTVWLTGLC